MKRYIIIEGHFDNGFNIIGPFDSMENAVEWEQTHATVNFQICQLVNPEKDIFVKSVGHPTE